MRRPPTGPRGRGSLIALVAVALAGTVATARAQSRRYPPPPVDTEAAEEARSDFWEEVVRPGAARYESLLTRATDALRMRGADLRLAKQMLTEAVELRPGDADGWGYLGYVAERNHDFATCADAYGKAQVRDADWRPSRLARPGEPSARARALAERPIELAVAVCRSRVGDLTGAVRDLEALVARGDTSAETWLVLGEIYMAQGWLTDAIDALTRSVAERPEAANRWLLAIAYDRARRPAEAASAADLARNYDTNANATAGDARTRVPPADSFYLLGFAAMHRPEAAQVYFRKYLAEAPADSPWRARAREHLDALAATDLAERVQIEGVAERAAVEAAVRPHLTRLRGCLDELPTVLIELRVTQVGPRRHRTPPRARPAPRVRPVPRVTTRPGVRHPPRRRPTGLTPARRPPRVVMRPPDAQSPGVRAHLVIAYDLGTLDQQLDTAVGCVEKVGAGIRLPRPAADTYSTVRVPVLGP